MTTYDFGDGVNISHLVYDRDGVLSDATVAITVTKPDGTTISPSVTHVSTGTYRAATFAGDLSGPWTYKVDVSGAVVDVAYGEFTVFPGDTTVKPTALTRIAKNAAATLATVFLLDETPTDSSTTVTYTVVDAAGGAVATGNAVHGSTGVYRFVLPAQTALKKLAVTWSATIGGSATTTTTYAEIVGGFFFSLAEARNSDESLGDADLYPLADLVAGRLEVEAECEMICDLGMVPRYARVVIDGTGTSELLLQHPDVGRSVAAVRTIRSVSMSDSPDGTFTSFTAAQLADLAATGDGKLVRTGGDVFTEGRANVVVEYEYGLDRPPPDLVRESKIRLRTVVNANKSGVPDRASSFTVAEGGTYRLDMPGAFKTGIPTVDAAYGRYSRRSTGTGANARQVPASRTLTYTPQAGALFHGRRRG
jgi:hypothetical protein